MIIVILTISAFLLSIVLVFASDLLVGSSYTKYLPGYNCGRCGYGSCEGMSEAIKDNYENYHKCPFIKGKLK